MQKFLKIRGAKEHNLQNIDIDLPREKLIVMTGLSGSGKSSLAFDTIFAEGQRRYVESLSTYARMFLGQSHKPDVQSISGLSPTVAIDQKTNSHNPRSTVGTVTEVYDYLRLLFARLGKAHCPRCRQPISHLSPDEILQAIRQYEEGSRLLILAPLVLGAKGEYKKLLNDYHEKGYVRFFIDGQIYDLDDSPVNLDKQKKHTIAVVVDRIILRYGDLTRVAASVENALKLANGILFVKNLSNSAAAATLSSFSQADLGTLFSTINACPTCHISIGKIEQRLFSFNNPQGACPECKGLGSFKSVDQQAVVAHPERSLKAGAIQAPGWNYGNNYGTALLQALADYYKIDLDKPWQELSAETRNLVLYGNNNELIPVDTSKFHFKTASNQRSFEGIINSLNRRYWENINSSEITAIYEPIMRETLCPKCHGQRLNEQALSVYYCDKNIAELCALPLNELYTFLADSKKTLSANENKIADKLLEAILNRLSFMLEVGLSYLTLSRAAMTLSGGEAQRIRLATQIGAGLTGVIYILDEPSIGLHQRDNTRLLKSLQRLKNLGNTVIVVEHDEETMLKSDYLVDLGPGAGKNGGRIVAQGTPEEVMQNPASLTGAYLSGKKFIPYNPVKRCGNGKFLQIVKASCHNLRDVTVEFPLGKFIAVTGVSGSGKSSLINSTLLPALQAKLNKSTLMPANLQAINNCENIDKVINIDQSPIGRTPRSNPATYTGVFDRIRELFAAMPLARARGYKAGRFSFNVSGGRCEACKGDGVKCISMNFLPDVYVDCDVCHGKRYQSNTLEVQVNGKNIADVLEMDIATAYEFFAAYPAITGKLQALIDVGLGYLSLGHNSTLLSGGEAQRVKLAAELAKKSTGSTFYILDEPTTGLHIDDVARLINILQKLVDQGNTVLVIEHNLDVIKVADYIIDLGPEGGINGGQVIATGTPEEVMADKNSYTGEYLAKMIKAAANNGVKA